MRKSDKKTEKQLREGLTLVCDHLLTLNIEFEWITHTVNFDRLPSSLKVICIFKSRAAQESFRRSPHFNNLLELINGQLKQQGLHLKLSSTQLLLDNEESCTLQHQGNWSVRLSMH